MTLGVRVYGVVSVSEMVIGMWSEDISWTVRQEERRARFGEAKGMSGEVCCVFAL